MPKFIKTYGIHGLLEWHGMLRAGSVSMKVSFTNGVTTAYGVSPATLITKDELTQFVVEHSNRFKDGTIKLISARIIPGTDTDKTESPAKADGAFVDLGKAYTLDGEQNTDNNDRVITVNSKSDAVEYLKDNFKDKGYTSVKLRTKEAFDTACKECGVRFVW